MCGICGIALADSDAAVDPSELARMSATIVHRGPDSEGSFLGAGVGLAARRLKIIDLDHGDQPIANEDATLQLVFNGEIYNFRELRRELERLGHRFRTHSDTEVIVHAWEEWGDASLGRLRGMFAFALWNAEDDSLLLAVDRFGIKPLYYAHSPASLVFGSELGAVAACNRVPRELDDAALAEYLTLGYIPPPATIFERVRKLPPGTLLRWRRGESPATARYWAPPAETQRRPASDLRRELRSALRDAVESHLVSDVPVGVLLSGGLDSSTVLALMCELGAAPVQTFSVGFGARGFDELEPARRVAGYFGAEHHELVLESDAPAVLEEIVGHFHEPFADPAALPLYEVARLAGSHVKVALSGDGGDELLVGYTTFRGVEAARIAQRLPGPVRHWLRATRPLPRGPSRLAGAARLWDTRLRESTLPPLDAYRRKITLAGLDALAPLLSGDLRSRLAGRDPFRRVDAVLDGHAGPPLARAVAASRGVSLPGDMLVKVDRMSMAHSLEVRVPLLDHVLAELVATIPVEQLFPRWRLKGLIKDTLGDVLPRDVIRRPKHGFDVPLALWFRGDLGRFAEDVLLDPRSRDRGLVEPRTLAAALRAQRAGDANSAPQLWTLLVLELWFAACFDSTTK